MRQRLARNRDLPNNLYTHPKGFRYKHPQTGKFHYVGTDREKAKAAAKKLNALLVKSNDIVAKVLGDQHTLAVCIDLFERDDVPLKEWKQKTADEYQFQLNKLRKDYGERIIEDLTVKDCAGILREVTASARSRIRYRTLLGWILDCATAEGWIEVNPIRNTKKLKAPKRKRQRLTLKAYKAIWEKASPWLRNAMDLSLHTLLRLTDVVCCKFEDVKEPHLYVVPRKTDDSTYVRLKMLMNPELKAVAVRCRDNTLSPYLAHKMPERIRKSKQKDHHTQVSPGELDEAFAEARMLAGIEGDHPPTFHEIRSLGGDLYRKAGWTLKEVQALMGHASAAMTKAYLEGHEAPWIEVQAGLKI